MNNIIEIEDNSYFPHLVILPTLTGFLLIGTEHVYNKVNKICGGNHEPRHHNLSKVCKQENWQTRSKHKILEQSYGKRIFQGLFP